MILFRYLTREVMITLLAVSITLLVIVMSGRFVGYLAQAASGDLAPEVVLTIMFYRMPSFLELVLPLSLFIAILLAYGRLYVESEMTVMSACGVSTGRLALFTLAPSLFVAAIVAWLSLYASPVGIERVQNIFQDAKNSSGLELLVAGRFRVDDKTGRVTYIESLTDDRQTMRQVFSAEQTNTASGTELSVVFAEQGHIDINSDINGRYLVLDNGYRYIGQPGEQAFQVTEFEKFGQLIAENQDVQRRYTKQDARSTQALINSDRLDDKATLQWRLSLAILVPIIGLIAQALSRTNHRRGRYVKMLPAFLIYIFYLVILNAMRDAIEKENISEQLGMWWVHVVFGLLALVLLFGGEWWRRIRYRQTSGKVK